VLFVLMLAGCLSVPAKKPENQAPQSGGAAVKTGWSLLKYSYADSASINDTKISIKFDLALAKWTGTPEEEREVNAEFYGNLTPDEFAKKIEQDADGTWHDTIAHLNDNEGDRAPFDSMNWEYQEKFTVTKDSYCGVDILKDERFSFMGGAHPITEVRCSVYDETKPAGSRFVHLAGLFTAEGQAALPHLLFANCDNDKRTMLFEDSIEPNENFFISAKGVTFHYNAADIAPYSAGPVEITVPWPALKGSQPRLLTQDGNRYGKL
jgi:hypothetical protein